jgi:hypothetical protein
MNNVLLGYIISALCVKNGFNIHIPNNNGVFVESVSILGFLLHDKTTKKKKKIKSACHNFNFLHS